MDILIFLGALIVLLVGVYLLVKLAESRRDKRRHPKYQSLNPEARLKQRHTGRPYLMHQTMSRPNTSHEIWKASRHKVNESNWQSGTFTAHKVVSDAELSSGIGKQHEGLAMPSVEYNPPETTERPDKTLGVRSARVAGTKGNRRGH